MAEASPPTVLRAVDVASPDIYLSSPSGRLRQGEIIANLPQSKLTIASLRSLVRWNPDSGEPKPELEVNLAEHPLVVVLTQDCDLEQDYAARQSGPGKLSDILFCDVHLAEPFKVELRKSLKEWRVIAENQSPRYHFLCRVDVSQDADGKGLNSLAIDFKRHFTLPADEVYERLAIGGTVRRCYLQSPYIEHLLQRFCSFQSRVALPLDHPTESDS